MRIAGSGITTFNAKVKPDFRPLTSLALKWIQLANGNWRAVDRGSSTDMYRARIRLYGTESLIDQFLDEVEYNRITCSHVLTLSNFNATEHIFGADVDHSSSISATITEIDSREQRTWKGFGVSCVLQASSPSFTGTPALPSLECLSWGYEGDSSWTWNKSDSYNGTFNYADRKSDVGLFNGRFLFSDADMIALRGYLRTQRGATISIPDIDGVSTPFGSRRDSGYPYNVKVIDWEDMGMRDVRHWWMSLTLAEEV